MFIILLAALFIPSVSTAKDVSKWTHYFRQLSTPKTCVRKKRKVCVIRRETFTACVIANKLEMSMLSEKKNGFLCMAMKNILCLRYSRTKRANRSSNHSLSSFLLSWCCFQSRWKVCSLL